MPCTSLLAWGCEVHRQRSRIRLHCPLPPLPFAGCHNATPTLRLSLPAQTWIHGSPAKQQPARRCACGSGRKKKGGSAGGSGGGSDINPSHRNMEVIRESREQQLAATDMLAKLLQAADPAAVAQQYVSSLDEAFFWSANTYLAMVGGQLSD